MIKRLFSLICLLSSFYITALANQEFAVNIAKGENDRQTIDLPYARVTFELVSSYSNIARVRVIVENITQNQAILLFKNAQDEKALKKHKPKFEFEKTYPGGKGHRSVSGCKEIADYFESVVPAETVILFTMDASTNETVRLSLPFYLAKFKPKDLSKSGKNNINYKILAEDIIDFDLSVKAWSESEPVYVETKKAVYEFVDSLKNVTFCPNKKHSPALSLQQKPYLERKDSLVNVISKVIRDSDWMSTDEPYQAYNTLLKSLNDINLDDYNKDCGAHKAAKRRHSCGYCSLSAQQIYHQLDDLYQQLHAGKITQEEAAKKARALYNCYQNSSKRKKDSFYTGKISGFYNRIVK